MNITLSEELGKIITRKLSTGVYHSANDVIEEGLRLLDERDSRKESEKKLLNVI